MFLYKITMRVTEIFEDPTNQEQETVNVIDHTNLVSAPTPNQAIKKLVLPKIEEQQTLTVTVTLEGETTEKIKQVVRFKKASYQYNTDKDKSQQK